MDLFAALPEHAKPDAPVRVTGKGLYAALPGTGPEGETCGSCRYLRRKRNRYLKCALVIGKWTGGPGTDVKARSPACSKWTKPEEGR